MYKLKNIKLTNLLGAVCSLALLAIGLMAIVPSVTEEANAEGEVTAGGVNAHLSVVANPMIAIGLSTSTLDYNFTPRSIAEFQTQPTTLTVQTNNTDGYTIYMETSSGKLSNGAGGTISSIVGNEVVSDKFAANTWGYSIDSDSYNAIPVANTAIKPVPGQITTDSATSYQLKFGVNINSSLPAGTYTGDVILSAVANPIKITNMMQLTDMQDMTHELCQNTMGTDGNPVTIGNEPSIQLKDTRDNKWYWVTKLADQNCWMTQNLDLDIPAEPSADFISKSDNIPAEWKPTEGTRSGALNLNGYSNDDYTSSYSWNPGDYKRIDAGEHSGCRLEAGGSFSSCDRVSNTVAIDGGSVPANVKNNVDLHYHIGNYYQWPAATAGTGNGVTTKGIDVSGSICPKNWQLPQDKDSTAEIKTATYSQLVDVYSVGKEVSILVNSPLYFLKAGYLADTGYYGIGYDGGYWSRTIGSSVSAYRLGFSGSSSIYLSTYDYRSYGRSVRCVSR